MAFIDALNDIVNALGEKANSAVEATKLTVSLNQQKKILAEAQRQMGEYYFAKFMEDGVAEEDILAAAEQGKVAQEAIEDLSAQLKELEAVMNMPITPGKKCCEECGVYCDSKYNFCPECGAAFPEEEEQVEATEPEEVETSVEIIEEAEILETEEVSSEEIAEETEEA